MQRMETDVPLQQSVKFLEKNGIAQDLPEKGEYTIRSRNHGNRPGVIRQLAGHVKRALERFGYRGKIFTTKNHEYVTIEEDAVKTLRTACKFFSRRKY